MWAATLAATAAVLLSACAAPILGSGPGPIVLPARVPLAPADSDAQAKRYAVPAGKALIYVFRSELHGSAFRMPVSLNGRAAGATAWRTYFLFEVDPGSHEIASHAENVSTLKIDAEAGRKYFVWQEVKMGTMRPRSELSIVDEETGRRGVEESRRVSQAF